MRRQLGTHHPFHQSDRELFHQSGFTKQILRPLADLQSSSNNSLEIVIIFAPFTKHEPNLRFTNYLTLPLPKPRLPRDTQQRHACRCRLRPRSNDHQKKKPNQTKHHQPTSLVTLQKSGIITVKIESEHPFNQATDNVCLEDAKRLEFRYADR